LLNYNISLNTNTKGASGVNSEQKQEDVKVGESKKFLVKKETTSLFL